MTQNEIKVLLTIWGQWSRTSADIAGTSYKTQPCFKLIQASGFGETANDDVMLLIDSAMAWLKQHSEFDFLMLKLKYRYSYSYNRIADKLTKELPQYRNAGKKMCDKYAKSLVELAELTLLRYFENNLK